MKLTIQLEKDIVKFLNENTPENVAYLIKMAHLERTGKMTKEDFEIANILKKEFSEIIDMNEGSNDNLETKIDACVQEALLHFGLIKPNPKKLSLKDKIANFFKPNKGFRSYE